MAVLRAVAEAMLPPLEQRAEEVAATGDPLSAQLLRHSSSAGASDEVIYKVGAGEGQSVRAFFLGVCGCAGPAYWLPLERRGNALGQPGRAAQRQPHRRCAIPLLLKNKTEKIITLAGPNLSATPAPHTSLPYRSSS